MTTKTATYARAASGKLEVIFRADFGSSTTTDAGFPGQNGESNVVLMCRVLDATSAEVGKTYIRSSDPSAHLLLTYPGGNASWTLEMSDVYHSIGGLGGVWANSPRATCILIKA